MYLIPKEGKDAGDIKLKIQTLEPECQSNSEYYISLLVHGETETLEQNWMTECIGLKKLTRCENIHSIIVDVYVPNFGFQMVRTINRTHSTI